MMALRQLLGVFCLTIHLLISSLGVDGALDHRELPNASQNSISQLGSSFRTAAASSRPNTLSSQGIVAPQSTPTNGQHLVKADARILRGPWPLQPPRPFHTSIPRHQTLFSANSLLSSSRAAFTQSGARSSLSTERRFYASDSAIKSSIASRSGSVSSSAYTDGFRVVQPSDTIPGLVLASRRNNSTTPVWSRLKSMPGLAPTSSATRTTNSDFAISGGNNVSASFKSMGTASGIGESSSLKQYLFSNQNGTNGRTSLQRPHGARPVKWPLSWLMTGSNTTLGGLSQMLNVTSATASNEDLSSNSNFTRSKADECLAQGNSLESPNISRAPYKKPERMNLSGSSVALPLSGMVRPLGADSGARYPENCSGLATSTAHVVYEIFTLTISVNETVTLGPNATTPLPVLITPPPACLTITALCEGDSCPTSDSLPCNSPGIGKEPKGRVSPSTQPTFKSTLLVTKKSPAIVQQLSAVGNLFGPSTPSPPAVAAPPKLDGQQAAGQNPGSSKSDMSTQSDDSGSSDSDNDGQSDKPKSQQATPQQNPTNENSPSAPSNGQESDSQMPDVGSNGGQSVEGNQQVSTGDQPNAAASNGGASSDNRATSNHESTSNNGETSSGGSTNVEGDTSSKGGGASISGGALTNDDSVTNAGGVSSNGAVSNGGVDPSNRDPPMPEAGSSANSQGIQYVSSVVFAGNIPISIASDAVIVGSHIVPAGSPPTSVIANGQTIAIQPSQILAQGKTFHIQAATILPPARSATIGNVPVVLRHQDVEIGSKTFEHGLLPTSVEYHGQTYSWDASHLIAAGTTIAFPSVESSVPRVTAGGQVFSVFASHLKASGRDVLVPNTPKPSPFMFEGQTFSVNPSQIIAPDTSITLPPSNKVTPFVYIDHSVSVDASQFMARSTTIPLTSGSGIVTYNAQVLTIKPSEVIGPGTTIALSAPNDSGLSPTAVTTEGLTFSIGPAAAVVGKSTYSFVPGKAPTTILTHGEAVLVGSNGVQFGRVHVPVPTPTPSFSAITQGDLTFSVAPSEVVVGTHTDRIYSDMTPITTAVNGHIISIGPMGVGLASTTIALPTPTPSFSMAIEGSLTFSVAHSEVVFMGKTYNLASNKVPITTAIAGQIMTIGPKGIHILGTTINLPVIQTPTSVTADGLILSVGATDAVISGSTYSIGSGAPLQTVIMGSRTIKVGSAGVMLPSTTIAPEQTPIAVTAEGLTFSVDSSEAVINGTTYAVGKDAVAKTIVEGSTTIILGTDGVALQSTTIRPWLSAAQTSYSPAVETSGTSSTQLDTGILTPIVTGKGGDKKHAAGNSISIPSSSTLVALVLGISILALM